MRQIRIDGDVAYVPLTQGYEAVIDAADAALVVNALWLARTSHKKDGTLRTVYAARGVGTHKCKTSATFAYVAASRELHREFGRP